MEEIDRGITAINPRWRTAFWTLVVVSIVCLFSSSIAGIQPPSFPAGVHVISVVFLCSLTGYWLGLGESVWRIPISFIIAVAIGFYFDLAAYDFSIRNPLPFLLFTTGITAVTGVTVFVLKLRCGRLQRIPAGSIGREALQFSVRHILIWTTIVALLITSLRWLTENYEQSFDNVFLVTVMSVSFSALAIVEIWGILGTRVSFHRNFGVLCTFLVSTFVIVGVVPNNHWFWGVVTIASQALVVASIYCIRQQGYRFVKKAA